MTSGNPPTTQPEANATAPESPPESARIDKAVDDIRAAANINAPEATPAPSQAPEQSTKSAENVVENGAEEWRKSHPFLVACGNLLKNIKKFTIPNIIKILGKKLFSLFSKKKPSEDADESQEARPARANSRQMQGSPVPA